MARALLRGLSQRVFRPTPSPLPAPPPSSLCSWRRAFSEAKIFVGGLSFRTTEDGLRDAFAVHGEVSDVRIITDRETGRSRGFGFVTYFNESDAETALSKLQGHNLDGRAIRVDRASARPPPSRAGGGGGGGFGGGFTGLNEPAEPAADEADWGSLPPLNADLPFADDNTNTTNPSSS
jgi:RNA recognition motif-containing protein